jgi:hypothetical protein
MGKIYSSKKPGKSDVKAELVKAPNENTVILKYLTGEHKDKTVTITTGTLKRYWREETETTPKKTATEILGIDMDEVNKPYKPDVKPHYIPKPESVKRYEESKKKIKCNFTLPATYEEFADILASKSIKLKRVNSGYIALEDTSKLKILTGGIGILASDELGEEFVANGFTSRPCIEKGTPFRFDIVTEEQYNTMFDVLAKLYKED